MPLKESNLEELTVSDLRSLLDVDPNVWDDFVKTSQKEKISIKSLCHQFKKLTGSKLSNAIHNYVITYYHRTH